MQKVILDLPTLKALAGETRVAILKQLHYRRHMQTELATELELAVPTVKEHLNALEQAGLVVMIDDGRKWKYYELTKKAKAILEQEESSTALLILLGTWIIAVVGGAITWVSNLKSKIEPSALAMAEQAKEIASAPLAQEAITKPNPWAEVYWLVLSVLTILLAWKLWKCYVKNHQ